MDKRQLLHEVIPQTEFDTLLQEAFKFVTMLLKELLKKSDNTDLRMQGVTSIPLAIKRDSARLEYERGYTCRSQGLMYLLGCLALINESWSQ